MLKRLFQRRTKVDKIVLPKVNYNHFYLVPEKWEAIRKSRGWAKRGAASRLAENLNPRCTRQFTAMVINETCGCSSSFMAAYVDLVGIPEGQCWCHLFRRRRTKNIDTNHPIFNQLKYDGEIPYEKYSLSGEFRKGSYGAETK